MDVLSHYLMKYLTREQLKLGGKRILHDLQIWNSLNWWRGFSSITIPAKRTMQASQVKHILIVKTTTKNKVKFKGYDVEEKKNQDKLMVTHCLHIYWVHLFQPLQVICFIWIKHAANKAIDFCKIWHYCKWQLKVNRSVVKTMSLLIQYMMNTSMNTGHHL